MRSVPQSRLSPDLVTPVESPALPVPADDRRWLDDQEVVAPGRPALPEPDPENAIRVPQTGGGVGLESDVELVAENHAPMKSRQPVFYIRRAAIRMQATPERARRV
jgi:hypothetical protein